MIKHYHLRKYCFLSRKGSRKGDLNILLPLFLPNECAVAGDFLTMMVRKVIKII